MAKYKDDKNGGQQAIQIKTSKALGKPKAKHYRDIRFKLKVQVESKKITDRN